MAMTSEQAARAAGPDPDAEARRLLAQLDVPASRPIVEKPVASAKAAQRRARAARDAGDLQHATELDLLALTWAQVASDLLRAAASEQKLADVQRAVADLEQKSVRTQALIEQTIARRGRAEQNLATLAATGKVTQTKPEKDPVAPKAKPAQVAP